MTKIQRRRAMRRDVQIRRHVVACGFPVGVKIRASGWGNVRCVEQRFSDVLAAGEHVHIGTDGTVPRAGACSLYGTVYHPGVAS